MLTNVTEKTGSSCLNRAFLPDVLRIILCLGVFVYHLTPERCSSGPLSVNAFLVMSGFWVGVMVFSGRPFDSQVFFSKKCRRLLPMLLIAFGLGVIYRFVEGNGFFWMPREQWGYFDMSQFFFYYNRPLWYMVIECILLISVPFMVFLARKKGLLEAAWIVAIVFAGWLFSQVAENAPFGQGLYYSPWARMWQFMAGLVAARYVLRMKDSPVVQGRAFKAVTLLLFAVFVVAIGLLMVLKQDRDLNYLNYTFRFDVVTTLYCVPLVAGLYLWRFRVSQGLSRVLAYGAELTYPVFLLHMVVYQSCELLVERSTVTVSHAAVVGATAVLTLLLSVLMLRMDRLVRAL